MDDYSLVVIVPVCDCYRLQIALPRLDALEESKVALSAHPSGAEKILDDENRYRMVHGNYEWAWHAGLSVDKMVPTLSIENKSVLLENADQVPVMNRIKSRHYATLALRRSSETNSGDSHESPCLL